MLNLLFVCLGNICRSPSAEAVMNNLIKKRGYEDLIRCDSAGIVDYHEGDPADSRMMKHAAKRGISLTSISRPVKKDDFTTFDYIIPMDYDNKNALLSFKVTDGLKKKVRMITEFSGPKFKYDVVPDPYYGGERGFELVLDILEESCSNLLDYLIRQHPDNFNG